MEVQVSAAQAIKTGYKNCVGLYGTDSNIAKVPGQGVMHVPLINKGRKRRSKTGILIQHIFKLWWR